MSAAKSDLKFFQGGVIIIGKKVIMRQTAIRKRTEGLKESDTAVTPWDNASEGNTMSSREAVAKEENRRMT